MKRIYNEIPLQSILYLIPGYTKIIIEDCTEASFFRTDILPVGKWEGYASDSADVPYKYAHARVREVDVIGDNVLLFKVSTMYEQY